MILHLCPISLAFSALAAADKKETATLQIQQLESRVQGRLDTGFGSLREVLVSLVVFLAKPCVQGTTG